MTIGSVLITGTNRGIGLEFVKYFANLPKPPLHLFATCREPDEAKELQNIAKKNSNVHILKLDVQKHEQFLDVSEKVKNIVKNNGLNLLINNAGVLSRESFETVSRDNMLKTFDVNVTSTLFFTKAMLPLIIDAANKNSGAQVGINRAAIVNISSQVGSIEETTVCDNISYRISKAGVNMLTKLLSIDMREKGIMVVALHPGWVQTDMGGPEARLSSQDSVKGMASTLASLTEEHHGVLLNHKGRLISW